jgi:hypothetical protein
MRASAWVVNRWRWMYSTLTVELKDSAAALSSAEPTRPIDCSTPSLRQAPSYASLVYSLPPVAVEDHAVDVAAAGGGGHVQHATIRSVSWCSLMA